MTQPLVVLKDPDSGGNAREIATQTAMLKDLSVDLTSSVQLTSGIQNVRTQLRAMRAKLAGDSATTDVRAAADSLEREFTAVEDSLSQQKGGPFYEWPVKLTAKLVYLVNHVQSSDYEPTTQALEAHTFLKSQLRLVKGKYDVLMQKKLTAFNNMLHLRGLPTVITVVP